MAQNKTVELTFSASLFVDIFEFKLSFAMLIATREIKHRVNISC